VGGARRGWAGGGWDSPAAGTWRKAVEPRTPHFWYLRTILNCASAGCVKTTTYFRDVVRQKHPGIEEAWILRVIAEPLVVRRQADGRFALWGLVPEAHNRALRVVTLDDRESIPKAFFDRGFLKARTRSQFAPPPEKPAP